ncbi:MAG: SAM-dependent methyltransferase [Lachnospiraceae bacterium]|nr:SAM-dependent methyltransferase [Lachnospiraceae bacterium]
MEELKALFTELVNENLSRLILSNPIDRGKGSKVTVRPLLLKGEVRFQEALYRENKVFHYNGVAEEIIERLLNYLKDNFRQAEITGGEYQAVALISKKGRITVKKKHLQKDEKDQNENPRQGDGILQAHNRTKRYILKEGRPVDFLVGLGVQTPDGHVVKAKYDKFRQINRYLEFIEDVIKKLPVDRPLYIIDFGCGKSYLTFAMYYYLHEMKEYEVHITGLDLKTDVIEKCNALAEQYGYTGLHFEKGDISGYECTHPVDMVVSLHACDTATDHALEKAIRWNAGVILAVPCCQHEVNRQIDNKELEKILKYGLIKERLSALITDAIRANLLEEMGYETQILEFIDMEHTPKNLLIRAVKREGMRPKGRDIRKLTNFLHVETTLQKLFEEEH